ncbi:MAG: hypothetical protein V4805_07870 [Pseudomonadota bacterium]
MSKSPSKAKAIIATRKVVEFQSYFASTNSPINIFGNGADTIACWKQSLGDDALFTLFFDYGVLDDGDSGIRLTKTIRAAEKANGAQPCIIYLMADKPKPSDALFAHLLGASSVLLKTPETVLMTLVSQAEAVNRAQTNRRKRIYSQNRTIFDDATRAEIAFANTALRHCIGPATNQVTADAFDLMAKGKLAQTANAYREYLASRIPSEEMKSEFLRVTTIQNRKVIR